eukprot:3656123-Rhodomonas_salina.3
MHILPSTPPLPRAMRCGAELAYGAMRCVLTELGCGTDRGFGATRAVVPAVGVCGWRGLR